MRNIFGPNVLFCERVLLAAVTIHQRFHGEFNNFQTIDITTKQV